MSKRNTRHSCDPGVRSQKAFKLSAIASAVAIASGATPILVSAESATTADNAVIEEVVVTARKRSDNLQDVPLSVQAFTNDQIEELGITRFEDFAHLSPSISFISAGPGQQMMFIRGIADGSNPNRPNTATATLYLDDAPLTYAGGIADLHNYDIERIEVLNGPQGTYYGASATSGTVRIIANKPDPDELNGEVEVTAGMIDDGDDLRTLQGFVNIPLVEGVSALRVVGWYDESLGFVDNVRTTRTYMNGATVDNSGFDGDDYNEEKTWGVRATVRSDLGERWQGTLAAFIQEIETDGAWDHDPRRYGDLEVARFGPEYGDLSYGQVSLTLEGDVGIGDLVYTSSYFDRHAEDTADYSDYVEYASFGGWVQQFACDDFYWYGNVNCNDPSMFFQGDYESTRWSHEVRLTSPGDGPLNWIAGAYYEDNESDNFIFWDMPGIQHNGVPGAYYQSFYNASPLPNEWWSAAWESEWEQWAVFGELSYELTDKLTGTIGVRTFESEFSSPGTGWAGYFFNSKDGGIDSSGGTDDTIFKYSLDYQVNDNLLTYFTYSEGFRPGGGNTEGATNPSVPEIYEPDVLESYELGWKSTLVGGRVTFNGAVYSMKWEDFQTSVYDLLISPLIFRANAGNAEVTGFEAALVALVTEGLTLTAGVTYNKSELDGDFNSTVDPSVVWAPDGRELPYIPEWKWMTNARYEWTQSGNASGYAQATFSYTDEMWNLLITEPFQANATPELQDSYQLLDIRLGWDFASGKYGVELFGTNLLDERAEIFINTGSYDSRITTNRPRTFGVRFKTRFE